MENERNYNLNIYNQIRSVPEEAQKKITGGRLSGMTDIKPMWRIEKLTEIFGPVGKGWNYEVINKEIIDGANGEKMVSVEINLLIKGYDPIYGIGGSMLITNEKSGPRTNDEAFKMALTDAISVACKSLGMGADVYWGDSKYTEKKVPDNLTKEDAEKYEITFGKNKGKTLKEIINDTGYINWLVNSSKDEYLLKCIELLTHKTKPSDEELDDKCWLMSSIQALEIKLNIDHSKALAHYKVSSDSDMTIEQLKDYETRLKEMQDKKENKLSNEIRPSVKN